MANRNIKDLQTEMSIGNLTDGDVTVFETDGFVRGEGGALAARDEYPVYLQPATGVASPTVVGVDIGGVSRTMYSFDGGVTEEILSGSFEIPHDFAEGSEIEIHVHFRPDDNTAGDVELFFDWEHSPVNDAPAAQTTLSAVIPIALNNEHYHYVKAIDTLPANGYTLGDKIGFNLRRTPNGANDTYEGEILFEQVAMHIWVDTNGSRQRYVK